MANRNPIHFKGWKTRTGKLLHRTVEIHGGEWVTFGEHEANRYRQLVGDPGRMTPQYDR